MPDCVDPPMHDEQPTAPHPLLDQSATQPRIEELATRNHPVLALGQVTDRPRRPCSGKSMALTIHFMVKRIFRRGGGAHEISIAGLRARMARRIESPARCRCATMSR